MDASVLEKEKENIKPLIFGRSVSKLGNALIETRGPTAISKQRDKFEKNLQCDELDDPLQVYIDYIAWTHNHFPQGANTGSGLLQLLERCTSCFRDTPHYKNDPRYLKIWLEYAEYSDAPRDIFVYLAKKGIGQELALYYEQFASFLEARGLRADAREVYEIGIERNAWPINRLKRSLIHFETRSNALETSTSSGIHSSNTAQRQTASTVWSVSGPPAKKHRLAIHNDDSPATLKETVFTPNNAACLSSTVLATKENIIAPKPWTGEVLKQNEESLEKKSAKFQVFRDDMASSTKEFELLEENDETFSNVFQPGKPREKLCVNLNLLYPHQDNEEFSIQEILALTNMHGTPQSKQLSRQEDEYRETEQTFTIPLRDDDTLHRTKSPTITMMSRMTTNEVLGMFNDAALNMNSDDETGKEFEDSTNYDGFQTETIHVESQDADCHQAEKVATPPTDQYESEEGSSPFLERP
ncbi:hypothetical protein OXX59_009041 [Metschnikowia pulcherrima]